MNKLRPIALLLCLCLLLTACGMPGLPGAKDEEETPVRTEHKAETVLPAVGVRMEREDTDGSEYVLIRGLDAESKTVWLRSAGPIDKKPVTRIEEIGLWKDRYYFNYGGSVTCLSLATGEQLWSNQDFRGGSICSLIGDDGSIYLCGREGPDFFACDAEGSTLSRIALFCAGFSSPQGISRHGDRELEILLTNGNSYIPFYVNLDDYSVSSPVLTAETAPPTPSPAPAESRLVAERET